MDTPVALTIGGSDPSGGAGVQADLKTFHQFGVYGEAVVTLITVQNSQGLRRVHVLDSALVSEQLHAVISDIPPRAAKTGALGSRSVVEALAEAAAGFSFPLVIDPVMISKNGGRLLDESARHSFAKKLLPRAFLLTPNLDEAAAFAGMPVTNLDQMITAAKRILEMGPANVLVKGGHLKGEPIDVLLSSASERFDFRTPRIDTRHTHGTGCTYSAAITAGLAKGLSLVEAIQHAKNFVTAAIRTNPGLGSGSGPLNHFARQ